MRITPLDIRKQEFRKAMRGLDPEEVYAFLSTVAEEYEAVLNDNKALRERLLELDDKVQEYRTMERTLRDTLLTAERVTADAKENARREANLIIKEAQIEAEKALRDIKNEAMKLRREIQDLRRERESYLARMKVLAESYIRFIESAGKEFEEADKRSEPLARAGAEEAAGGKGPRKEQAAAAMDQRFAQEKREVQRAHPAPETQPLRPIPEPGAETTPPPGPHATSVAPERSSEPGPTSAPHGTQAPDRSPVPEGEARAVSAGTQAPGEAAPASRMDTPGDSSETDTQALRTRIALPDLNAILDRMVEGQRETLRSEAPDPYSSENAWPQEQEESQEHFEPIPGSPESATVRDSSPDTASQSPPAPIPQPEGEEEWSIERIRRDMLSDATPEDDEHS